jgi:hypothetical protein
LNFTALNWGGVWNLAAKTLQVFKSKQIGPCLTGEEGQGHRRPNSSDGWCRGWRRTGPRASGAQGAPSGGLGKGKGRPEVGFPRRTEAAAERSSTARGFPARRPSSGPVAVARGEKATGVVGLVREGAEGWVRWEQKLTGEEVATVRWFRWESGREEWPGSVSGVRGSSLGGCSGAGRAGVSCPRRIGGRRSGGRGRRWCSRLGVCAAREIEGNGRGMS